MNWLGKLVVRYRKAIIIFYIIILFPAAFGYLRTGINYDLLSYLPDELNSKQGERLLEEEFALSGLGLLLARGKQVWEIERLIDSLESIRGVKDVVWLGDYTDIYVPLDFIEAAVKERFVSGDTVLLQIQFAENARSPQTNAAVARINSLIGADPDLLFGGEPAIIAEMQATIDREMIYYTAVAVAMILLVLAISSSYYLDPLLFLVSVGVAVIINLGTNFFQGQISFITSSIAAVMQLGISLDYSIFLMHRFEEEMEQHSTAEEAMAATINKTTAAIASSALTTISGFAALLFMQNGIGQDMGLVLAKGITLSLIVNLTFLPSLILAVYKFSRRCRHRILLPSFRPVSGWVVKLKWVFLGFFLLLLVPSYLAQKKVAFYYSNKHYLPRNSAAVQSTNIIMNEFGAVDVVYVITANEGRARERLLVKAIKDLPGVEAVVALSEQVDPAISDVLIPPEIVAEFEGEDHRYLLAFLSAFADEQESFAVVDSIRREAGRFHAQCYVTGEAALTRDMAMLLDSDARNVALVSIAMIFLIVALTFKSLSLPLIIIMTIELAVWINLSLLYYQGQAVSSLTPIVIGAIQLGATVDYAILFTMRYRENTVLFDRRIEAIRQTVEDTGRSILTSALTLCSATASITFIAGIKATGEIAMLIGRGAIISMLVIFTLLPALLLVFEKPIGRTTSGWAPAPFPPAVPEMKSTARRD